MVLGAPFCQKKLYLQWNILGRNKSFHAIKSTSCYWWWPICQKCCFYDVIFHKKNNSFLTNKKTTNCCRYHWFAKRSLAMEGFLKTITISHWGEDNPMLFGSRICLKSYFCDGLCYENQIIFHLQKNHQMFLEWPIWQKDIFSTKYFSINTYICI